MSHPEAFQLGQENIELKSHSAAAVNLRVNVPRLSYLVVNSVSIYAVPIHMPQIKYSFFIEDNQMLLRS